MARAKRSGREGSKGRTLPIPLDLFRIRLILSAIINAIVRCKQFTSVLLWRRRDIRRGKMNSTTCVGDGELGSLEEML